MLVDSRLLKWQSVLIEIKAIPQYIAKTSQFEN